MDTPLIPPEDTGSRLNEGTLEEAIAFQLYKISVFNDVFINDGICGNTADLAILGIGNSEILDIFGRTFGYSEIHAQAIGDVAAHFFDQNGKFINLYRNTLCASVEDIRNAKESVAIACGKEKAEAIAGALRTKMIDTLITDEYTARHILYYFLIEIFNFY